jgi:type I restriction enzyme S subunit
MEPSDLPNGWRWVWLGDLLVDVQSGFACGRKRSTPGLRHLRMDNIGPNGRVDLSKVTYVDYDSQKASKYWLRKGDVLFNNTNSAELVGKSALFDIEDGDYFYSNHLTRLRVRPSVLTPGWLLLSLRQLWQGRYFERICNRWIGQAAVNAQKLRETEIPLPSLEEQRHIVGRMEELAQRIEEAWGLRRAARQQAEALLPAAADEIFGSAQAQAWPVQSLGDALQDIRYGTSTKASTSGVGVPVIRMGNIQDGGLVLDDLKYLELPAGEFERLLLGRGDILVNRTNSPALVGKSAVFEEPGQYVFASYLIRMRLHLQKAEPRFVCAYINSRRGRDYVASRRKQVTGQANINSRTLRAMPIPLPPIDEQRCIVAYLDAVGAKAHELRRLQAETQRELDALLPSVLDRAFRGEL